MVAADATLAVGVFAMGVGGVVSVRGVECRDIERRTSFFEVADLAVPFLEAVGMVGGCGRSRWCSAVR